MLLEIAVADGYSIAFEFVKDPAQHGLRNDLATYQQNPRYDTLLPSLHTDDTQRSLAVANWIMDGDYFAPDSFIEYLKLEFANYPRAGYSKGFQALMEEDLSAIDMMRRITHKADSNGSIMGVLPCGYLRDPVDVRMAATIQAITTHSHATVPYAQGLAMAAHYFIHDLGSRTDLLEFLKSECEGDLAENVPDKATGFSGMTAKLTAETVLALVLGTNSLSDMLYRAVDLRGDTDSIAALAVGLGSVCREIENDLPQVLIDGVEQGDPKFKARMLAKEEVLREFS
jgi:ADP-ribosylglycohydrolase